MLDQKLAREVHFLNLTGNISRPPLRWGNDGVHWIFEQILGGPNFLPGTGDKRSGFPFV
jgi:hypothetical protein